MSHLFWYTNQITLSIRGNTKNPSAKLLFQLKRHLQEEGATDIQRTANSLSFKGGFFRLASSWNALTAVGKGQIDVAVEGRKLVVTYRLSFWQLILGCSLLTALLAVPILYFPIDNLTKGIAIINIGLLFCGGNMAFALYRFPKLIGKAWMEAFHVHEDSFLGQWYK